jgi:molybdopterin-guanine dinucleotide biosynthesis protein A
MSGRTAGVVGAVLAGGAGRRIGGDKALVPLGGRPLVAHPVEVLLGCFAEVVVVVKADTALPDLPPGVVRWDEPAEPRHPLTGLVHALRAAAGRPVFACAADMALLDAATVTAVCAAHRPGDLAVVAQAGGRLQPLCARYAPAALAALERTAPDASLTAAVAALDPRVVPFADDAPFFNVNAPDDLRRAARLADRRR